VDFRAVQSHRAHPEQAHLARQLQHPHWLEMTRSALMNAGAWPLGPANDFPNLNIRLIFYCHFGAFFAELKYAGGRIGTVRRAFVYTEWVRVSCSPPFPPLSFASR
jgi:hypothetical protein